VPSWLLRVRALQAGELRASGDDDADVVFLAKGLRQLPVNRTELAVPVPFIGSKIVVTVLPGDAAFVPLKGGRMLKPLLIIAAISVAGMTAYSQESHTPETGTPTPNSAPLAAREQVNPVKPTVESISAAKKIYGYDCAMCHGENGDGKGDTANDMKLSVRDLRDPSTLKGMSDGEMYYIIENGNGKCPPEDGRAKPDRIWNLVVYMRSFSDPKVLPTK
jgi:mono/diheme cytochrome c family protein